MVERLVAVDPENPPGELAGRLSTTDVQAVDDALRTVLALDWRPRRPGEHQLEGGPHGSCQQPLLPWEELAEQPQAMTT